MVGRPSGSRAASVAGPRVEVGHVPAATDLGARADRQIEKSRVEPGSIEPDGGLAACLGAVGQAECRARAGLDAHRGDRSRDGGESGRVQAGSPQRRDGRRRREDAAGAPGPGGRPLQDDDLATRRGESGGQDGPGRAATDDRDPDPLDDCARSLAGPLRVRRRRERSPDLHGRRHGGDRVALAERATDRPDRRQAGAQQQRPGLDRPIRAQDRERSVVARVPVPGQEVADQPRADPARAASGRGR